MERALIEEHAAATSGESWFRELDYNYMALSWETAEQSFDRAMFALYYEGLKRMAV